MKRMLTNPYFCVVFLIIAIFEFVMLIRHDFFKKALIERGYLKQKPEERADYQCLLGWENTLRKMNYKADACFVGNSITYESDFQRDYPNLKIVNLGYSGDRIQGMIARHKQIAEIHPDKIFIMAGINDIGKRYMTMDLFQDMYNELLDSIQYSNPGAEIYLESMLPVNHQLNPEWCSTDKIKNANKIIEQIAINRSLIFVDLFSLYANEEDELPEEMTYDGVHLTKSSYKLWSDAVREYLL